MFLSMLLWAATSTRGLLCEVSSRVNRYLTLSATRIEYLNNGGKPAIETKATTSIQTRHNNRPLNITPYLDTIYENAGEFKSTKIE
jgi:hypothetical protein